jgi:hypothetical protein
LNLYFAARKQQTNEVRNDGKKEFKQIKKIIKFSEKYSKAKSNIFRAFDT